MQQNTAKKQAEYAELLKKPQWQKRRLQMLEKRQRANEANDEDRQAKAEAAARQGRATDEAVRAALERLRAARHSAPDESRGRLNQ